MTGYQELATDPSYEAQILAFTAPMVGNYGVDGHRDESACPHVRAVVMREARGPGWTDWLRAHGCEEAQGYFLARPLPFDEMLAKLAAR